jgi:hypothetical protein
MYFPDFNKQISFYKNYSNNLIKLLQTHINSTDNYGFAKRQIAIDAKNSYLPILSAEIAHHQFCRLTRTEYIPKFSREDHLNDIINLNGKNPQLLASAIKQSSLMTDMLMNHLLGNRKTWEINESVVQNQKNKVHSRKRFQ